MSERDVVSWSHREIEGSDLAGERVLLDYRQGRYYGLNSTATVLFSLLQEPTTIGALIDSVSQRYSISRERAAEDVIAFVREMRDHGLIRLEAEPTQA